MKKEFLIMLMVIFNCCSSKNDTMSLNNARLTPNVFSKNKDNVLIATVEVKNPNNTIKIIELSFLNMMGAPVVGLNDNGLSGDKIAEDGIWSCQIPLPPLPHRLTMLPDGVFDIEMKAYDEFKNPIKLKDSILATKTKVQFIE